MLKNQSLITFSSIEKTEDSARTSNSNLNSKLSKTLLAFETVWMVGCFYLHYCLYRSTTRKDFRNKIFIIGKLLTCYSLLAPIAVSYGFMYGNIFLTYNYPNSENLGAWFCFTNQYVCHLTIMYLGAFTLFTASMKYSFIVHNDKAERFGVERIKSKVLILHVVVPITMSALHVISQGNMDPMIGINRCWGNEGSGTNNVTLFGSTHSSTDIFCQDRKYEVSEYVGEQLAEYIEPLLRTMCIGVSSFYIFTTCNMMELVLYFLLFRRLDR